MEEEKLQAAKAILLDNDDNKFAAIKAFMTQHGVDIDTAANYINQAYSALDAPTPPEVHSTPMLPAAPIEPEPHEVVVREYVVETKPQPEQNNHKVGLAILDAIVFSLFSCAVTFLRICIKVFTFMFIFCAQCFLAILLVFFSDKYTKKRHNYWD